MASSFELQSKLLKGVDVGDDRGKDYRADSGGY